MADIDPYPIYSVAVDPKFCPQCGTELETKELERGPYQFCPECEMIFARNPLAAVHVIVQRGDEVLLLDEPISQHEGLWSLPGGHCSYAESPKEAVIRELYEETGLQADISDLSIVTVYHAETETMAFHFSTYRLDFRDANGDLIPEAEGFKIEFVPVDVALASTDRLRKSDRDRIRKAFSDIS